MSTKDYPLKIRLNNVLWCLGHYTRLEVKIAEYSSHKGAPMELTDLDVLGIRVLPDLATHYTLADCTSNKAWLKSPIQRAFWLRGVMDFFGASMGYLALNTDGALQVQEVQRSVANRLGVSILTESNLAELESRVVNPEALSLKLATPEAWHYYESNLANLCKGLEPILKFRKYGYWITPPHEILHSMVALLTKQRTLMDPNSKFCKALAVDLLSLFSLSLLQMASHLYRVNPDDMQSETRAYFFGGHHEMRRREAIVTSIKKLIDAMPKQGTLFGQPFSLDPDYMPQLTELTFRFLGKPHHSSQIPRYLQVLLFEKTLYKGSNQPGMTYLEREFSDVTSKLSRDAAQFVAGATGLSEKLFEDLQ